MALVLRLQKFYPLQTPPATYLRALDSSKSDAQMRFKLILWPQFTYGIDKVKYYVAQ
jgi:hypothetical protein